MSDRLVKPSKSRTGRKGGINTSRNARPTDPDAILEQILNRKRPQREESKSEQRIVPQFECEKCQDRGYQTRVDGLNRYVEVCQCRQRKALEHRFRKAEIPFEYWDLQLPITDRVLTIAHVDVKNNITKEIDINSFLYQYISDLDNKIKKRCNILFCGNNGSGKTFASMIIAREGIVRGYSTRYITMSRYLNLKHRFRDDNSLKKVDEILEADILVLDDVGKEFYSETSTWTYSQVEDLFRYRFSKDAITIITSNFNLMADDNSGVSDPIEKVYVNSIRSLLKASCLCLELIIDEDYRQDVSLRLWESFDLKGMEVRG